MAIPIPSGLPMPQTLDNRQSDLITPPSAPAVVESLSAIDPRVALSIPLPVGGSQAGGQLQNLLQGAVAEESTLGVNLEPVAQQSVVLELGVSSAQANVVNDISSENLLSQSLSKLDSMGGAVLGQLLSDILQLEASDLGAKTPTESTGVTQPSQNLQNAIVNWPNTVVNQSSMTSTDPRVAMNNLYQNLQSSGIFAADQLRKIMFPASDDETNYTDSAINTKERAIQLLEQLSGNSGALPDSVKLLLRGDLLWQGQLMPNVQARLYREDAWESDSHQSGQLQKGSRLTLEVNLPSLGGVKVVGTQFGEDISMAIESASNAQVILKNSFEQLLEQIQSQVGLGVNVYFSKRADS